MNWHSKYFVPVSLFNFQTGILAGFRKKITMETFVLKDASYLFCSAMIICIYRLILHPVE